MLLGALLTPLAVAGTPQPRDVEVEKARAVFSALVAAEHRPSSAPPPPTRTGSDLLDVYRSGELALVVDTDGEWLAEAFPHVAGNDLNWILDSISGAFYDHFDNDYEYLCVLLVNDMGFFGAFYAPLANDVRGIGYDSLVASEVFDQSRNALNGVIFMNAAEL